MTAGAVVYSDCILIIYCHFYFDALEEKDLIKSGCKRFMLFFSLDIMKYLYS